jgi:hypothetical protein
MYCDECKIKIDGKTSVCPLCHKKIVNDQEKYAFPIPAPKAKARSFFLLIYSLISIAIIITSLAINIINSEKILWSIIVITALVYIFLAIRYTIIAQSHFRQRLLGQTVFLTIVFYVVKLVIGGNDWIFTLCLPALYITSIIMLSTHLLKFTRYAKKNVIICYIIGILGLIPVITVYFFQLPLKAPAIVASSMGILMALIISFTFRKDIIGEVKKFFQR